MLSCATAILYIFSLPGSYGELRQAQAETTTTVSPSEDPDTQRKCDFYCQYENGPASYCKYWQTPPVCHGGDQPCSVDDCNVPDGATIPPGPTPSPDAAEVCDRYCMVLNGLSSYCKWWQSPAVCLYGDQPCGDIASCEAPIVGSSTFDLDGDQHAGPSAACDAYCQGLNGEESYCKHWQNPAVCLSGDQPCGPSICEPTSTTQAISTTTASTPSVPATTVTVGGDSDTTTEPQFGGDADTTTAPSSDDAAACDHYCRLLNGHSSYCKHWQSPAVCLHGDQPCDDAEICRAPIVGATTVDLEGDQHTGPSSACDAYCQDLNGVESYCKHWQNPAVCLSGDQPCGPSVCEPASTPQAISTTTASTASVPATTVTVGGDSDTTTEPQFGGDADTTTPTPTDGEACDRYCQLLNGPKSYCKYWQNPAVCQYGDEPCGDVAVCRAPIVGSTTYDLDGDKHDGQSSACDSYCEGLNGPESYCKYWQNPAVCLSGDQPCGPSVCEPTSTTQAISTTTASTASVPATTVTVGGDSDTTTEPQFGGDADTTTAPSSEDAAACDHYCRLLNGHSSYCKHWQSPAVCLHGDQPCDDAEICRAPIVGATTVDLDGDQHTGPSPACDAYCQGLNGEESYCKHWQNPAVCLSGDQPCGPSVCEPTSTTQAISTTTASTVSAAATTVTVGGDSDTTTEPQFGGDADTTTPTPTDGEACDRYCQLLNGPKSYCKYWQNPAVCQYGDEPCGDVAVCRAPIVGSTTYDLDGDKHDGQSSACDSYCEGLNGPESYCKFWQHPAVCLGGDQPCGPSVCDPVTTTTTSSISSSVPVATTVSTVLPDI
ncbi:hypothetical protein FOL47_002104 [Perkinsus chesapeaki]|uniref:Uncharacterized protein n=1 Tax=Perkinsus chesapeaki TaxID=330153 RepID=A0A7J6MFQ3_PERCH|nr:hypothetical protein FOL47_002104 [Perkinsus chesapeaki]